MSPMQSVTKLEASISAYLAAYRTVNALLEKFRNARASLLVFVANIDEIAPLRRPEFKRRTLKVPANAAESAIELMGQFGQYKEKLVELWEAIPLECRAGLLAPDPEW